MPKTTEQFTQKARAALSVVETTALNVLAVNLVEPQPVLYGLIQVFGAARYVLSDLGLDASEVLPLVKQIPPGVSNDTNLVLSQATKNLLTFAVDEARRLSHTQIGTGHLLLGLIRQRSPVVPLLLDYLALDEKLLISLIQRAILDCDEPLDRVSPIRQTNPNRRSGIWYEFTSRVMNAFAIEPLPPTDTPDPNSARMHNWAHLGYVTELIFRRPDHPRLYVYRGNLYRRKSHFKAAVADYITALRLKPDFAQAYFNRGAVKYSGGDYDAAIADWTRTIDLMPDHSSAHTSRGYAYACKNAEQSALADFDEAIRQNADKTLAHRGRGWLLLRNQEYERAILDFDNVLRDCPEDVLTLCNRGTAHTYQQNYAAAEADFNEMMRLNPDNSLSHSNLGWLCLLRQDYDGAIKNCDEAIRLGPENGAAYYSRGTAKAAKGDQAGAVLDYKYSLIYWKGLKTKSIAHYEQEMLDYIHQWGG